MKKRVCSWRACASLCLALAQGAVAGPEPENVPDLLTTFKGEKVITTSEVRYIVSENKCTYIVLHDGSSFDINMTLTAMAALLNPRSFMRVNRKYIVPLGQVERFEQDINGKERLILKHGHKSPRIVISRDNKHNVHDWVKGTL